MDKMNKLKMILNEIIVENESRKNGIPMGQDADNEKINDILRAYDLIDDEEILEAEFGLSGLHAIRDAENGMY